MDNGMFFVGRVRAGDADGLLFGDDEEMSASIVARFCVLRASSYSCWYASSFVCPEGSCTFSRSSAVLYSLIVVGGMAPHSAAQKVLAPPSLACRQGEKARGLRKRGGLFSRPHTHTKPNALGSRRSAPPPRRLRLCQRPPRPHATLRIPHAHSVYDVCQPLHIHLTHRQTREHIARRRARAPPREVARVAMSPLPRTERVPRARGRRPVSMRTTSNAVAATPPPPPPPSATASATSTTRPHPDARGYPRPGLTGVEGAHGRVPRHARDTRRPPAPAT